MKRPQRGSEIRDKFHVIGKIDQVEKGEEIVGRGSRSIFLIYSKIQ